MANAKLAKMEFLMQSDDAATLREFASDRGTTVAELIRAALYAQYPALADADRKRWARAADRTSELKALKSWAGKE